MEIAVPGAGAVSKVTDCTYSPGRSVRSQPRTSPSSSRIRSLSQTLFPSGLVSHTSAWLPSSTTAPHTPTWNAWASAPASPILPAHPGYRTQPIPQKARDKFPLCGALCIYQSCGHHRQTQQADYHQNGYSPIFSMFLLRQNDTTLLSLMSGHWLSQWPGHQRFKGRIFPAP